MSEGIGGGNDGLGSRFVRSTLYMGVVAWLTYALNFGINISVARLLGPSEFGLYALVFTFSEFLLILGALSMNQALINLEEESQSLYDTAWAITAVQAVLALAICVSLAPFLVHYRSTDAAWFIIILGVARALNFLTITPTAKIERSLNYGRLAAIGFVTGNVPNVIALYLAWNDFGAWSLIVRDLLNGVLHIVLISIVSGYRFRFQMSRASARRLMDFARPMFWARILDIVIERLDRIVVATLFGDRAIGLYHQARYLAGFSTLALRPLFQLAFNLYSRVKNDPPRLARSFAITNYFLARFVAAIAVVFLVAPGETIRLLLGDEWNAAAPVLRALGIYSALLPLLWNLKQLLFARAEALKNLRVRAVQAAVFLPGVLIAASVRSITAVAIALTVGTLIAVGLSLYYNRAVIQGDLPSAFVAPTAVCVLTVGLFAMAERFGFLGHVAWQLLPILAALVFAVLSLCVERGAIVRQFSFLLQQFRT